MIFSCVKEGVYIAFQRELQGELGLAIHLQRFLAPRDSQEVYIFETEDAILFRFADFIPCYKSPFPFVFSPFPKEFSLKVPDFI